MKDDYIFGTAIWVMKDLATHMQNQQILEYLHDVFIKILQHQAFVKKLKKYWI